VTIKIIRFLYAVTVCASAIVYFYVFKLSGVLLWVHPNPYIYYIILISCVCILISRVFFELVIVAFHIAENTGKFVERDMGQ
jgi:hypothetical protein